MPGVRGPLACAACATLLLAGCGGGSDPSPAKTAAVPAPEIRTDPQNLFDCLAHLHARVSIDPAATPRRFVDATMAVRAARDGQAAMSARFADGTHVDYEVWTTATEAHREHADAHGNVVIVYSGRTPRGKAVAATHACVAG